MRQTYFTGKPCKRGHIAERLVCNRVCIECYRIHTRNGVRKWEVTNPDKANAKAAKRRAARYHRTVAWANLEKIEEFYANAQRKTIETGIPHEVDHVVPLQGELVSGLHVEINLQIIPAIENSKKNNIFNL